MVLFNFIVFLQNIAKLTLLIVFPNFFVNFNNKCLNNLTGPM